MPIKPPFQLARCQIIHPPSPSLFNLSQIMQAEHREAKDWKQAFWRTHRKTQNYRQGAKAGGGSSDDWKLNIVSGFCQNC